jgi:formylmethanofuran dehydrogenase subunit E
MRNESDELPGGHYIVPFTEAVRFHGHVCPGLAVGYYASHLGIRWLASEKSPDDEVVALLGSGGCGADAVQAITGCTVGKGNLVIDDVGKQVYTFGIRGRREAVRIALRPEYTLERLDPGLLALRKKAARGDLSADEFMDLQRRIERVCRAILESPGEAVFDMKKITVDLPPKNGALAMVICSRCGEPVAAERAKKSGGHHVCPECHRAK